MPTLRVESAQDWDDVHRDFFRFHQDHLPPGTRYGEVIVVTVGDRHAHGVARGIRHLPGAELDDATALSRIQIERAIRDRLKLSPGVEAEFTFRRAKTIGILIWAWNTTDGMTRTAARLAVLSVVLGLVGLLLGAISLWS